MSTEQNKKIFFPPCFWFVFAQSCNNIYIYIVCVCVSSVVKACACCKNIPMLSSELLQYFEFQDMPFVCVIYCYNEKLKNVCGIAIFLLDSFCLHCGWSISFIICLLLRQKALDLPWGCLQCQLDAGFWQGENNKIPTCTKVFMLVLLKQQYQHEHFSTDGYFWVSESCRLQVSDLPGRYV